MNAERNANLCCGGFPFQTTPEHVHMARFLFIIHRSYFIVP